MAPSFTGRGWGWVGFLSSRSSEPVSRPTTLKIPPQVPLARSTGACWGERGGTTGARAANTAGGAAARSRPPCHEQRRPCGRRATKRSDWRNGRAAASTPIDSVFSDPASGVAGGRGDDLAGAKHTQRSVVGTAQVRSSSALVVHAQREGSKRARSPVTGTGRCGGAAGKAGLALFAQGTAVRRIETRSGTTRSATARSGAAGCARD